MQMQASFDRAVAEGARLPGSVSGVVTDLPQKLPQTLLENPPLNEDIKKPTQKTPQITGFVLCRL